MKKIKSKHMGLVFIASLLMFSTFFSPIIQVAEMKDLINKRSENLKTSGVSGYTVSHSVTYSVEINYTITYLNPRDWDYQTVVYINRTTDSSKTTDVPAYQETELLYNSITGYTGGAPTLISSGPHNNTFYSFDGLKSATSQIKINQKYIMTLNEISFADFSDSEIGTASSLINATYLNYITEKLNTSDPDLHTTAINLAGVNPSDSVVTKARKIHNWVYSYLTYNTSIGPGEDGDNGASYACDTGKGDCSDYASLMVTLLRTQGIPARKVMGMAINNVLGATPQVGEKFQYTYHRLGTDYNNPTGTGLPGHAWVEYYVPNIGWISCDPTWGPTYFNFVDCFHLVSTIGENQTYRGYTLQSAVGDLTEFPFTFDPYASVTDYDIDFAVSFTVIASNYATIDWVMIIIIVSIIGAVIVVSIVIIRSIARRGRNKSDW